MIRSILNFIKTIRSKPIGYWLGSVGEINYEIKEGHVVQFTSTGSAHDLFPLEALEYWSDNQESKLVMIGLTNGQRLVVKDSSGKLLSLLAKNSSTSRRRD